MCEAKDLALFLPLNSKIKIVNDYQKEFWIKIN